jgi:hypothetical protein
MDTRRSRPVSFSEGYIPPSTFESLQKPMIPRVASLEVELCSVVEGPRSPQQPPPRIAWLDSAHRHAIRFTMHLTLIALFETIFFWHIVAPSEDSALINLIQSYTGGLVSSIQAATPDQRTAFLNFFVSIVNITEVNLQGLAASVDRSTYNDALTRDSWLYTVGIASLCGFLSATAPIRRLPIKWVPVIGENIALIILLGLYEYMFFRTIIFRYRATSMEELDRMVVDQIQAAAIS